MRIIDFLRHTDKAAIVFFVRRILQELVPARPYAQCGYAPRCPCPSAAQQVTGVALGNEVTMNIGDKPCPCDRTQ